MTAPVRVAPRDLTTAWRDFDFHPSRFDLVTLPSQMPALIGFGSLVPEEIYRNSRCVCWSEAGILTVAFRVYGVSRLSPKEFVIGRIEASNEFLVRVLRAAGHFDVLIFDGSLEIADMTEANVQNFMATFLPRRPD